MICKFQLRPMNTKWMPANVILVALPTAARFSRGSDHNEYKLARNHPHNNSSNCSAGFLNGYSRVAVIILRKSVAKHDSQRAQLIPKNAAFLERNWPLLTPPQRKTYKHYCVAPRKTTCCSLQGTTSRSPARATNWSSTQTGARGNAFRHLGWLFNTEPSWPSCTSSLKINQPANKPSSLPLTSSTLIWRPPNQNSTMIMIIVRCPLKLEHALLLIIWHATFVLCALLM